MYKFGKMKETVVAVKDLPRQIRMTMQLAASAILLAIVAIIISIGTGARRAN